MSEGLPGFAPFDSSATGWLEAVLPAYLARTRWFPAKARVIAHVTATPLASIPLPKAVATLLLVGVEFEGGVTDEYLAPLCAVPADGAGEIPEQAIVTQVGDGTLLADATALPAFSTALLRLIVDNARLSGAHGQIICSSLGSLPLGALPTPMDAQQSNTSIRFGDRLILKLFRRIERGLNPDLEIGRFLTTRGFPAIAPVVGAIELAPPMGEPWSLAILHPFIPNRGDAWTVALALLGAFVAQQDGDLPPVPARLLDVLIPPEVENRLGESLAFARLIGRRTAELHLALVGDPADPAFAPEAATAKDQAALAKEVRTRWGRVHRLLTDGPLAGRRDAARLIDVGPVLAARITGFLARPPSGALIRCHGDYHLGQLLVRDDDVVIVDFEGEPSRSLAERRAKHSPLRDVAGMLRSFDYAAATVGSPQAEHWRGWASASFLRAYLDTFGGAMILPVSSEDLTAWLETLLLEKALYEVEYEANSRPEWVGIPLTGLARVLGI
ncbi:MAG: phosphotransferase [Dehalococcoidia bacterium]